MTDNLTFIQYDFDTVNRCDTSVINDVDNDGPIFHTFRTMVKLEGDCVQKESSLKTKVSQEKGQRKNKSYKKVLSPKKADDDAAWLQSAQTWKKKTFDPALTQFKTTWTKRLKSTKSNIKKVAERFKEQSEQWEQVLGKTSKIVQLVSRIVRKKLTVETWQPQVKGYVEDSSNPIKIRKLLNDLHGLPSYEAPYAHVIDIQLKIQKAFLNFQNSYYLMCVEYQQLLTLEGWEAKSKELSALKSQSDARLQTHQRTLNPQHAQRILTRMDTKSRLTDEDERVRGGLRKGLKQVDDSQKTEGTRLSILLLENVVMFLKQNCQLFEEKKFTEIQETCPPCLKSTNILQNLATHIDTLKGEGVQQYQRDENIKRLLTKLNIHPQNPSDHLSEKDKLAEVQRLAQQNLNAESENNAALATQIGELQKAKNLFVREGVQRIPRTEKALWKTMAGFPMYYNEELIAINQKAIPATEAMRLHFIDTLSGNNPLLQSIQWKRNPASKRVTSRSALTRTLSVRDLNRIALTSTVTKKEIRKAIKTLEQETSSEKTDVKKPHSRSPSTLIAVGSVALVALAAAYYWRVPLRERIEALRAQLGRS